MWSGAIVGGILCFVAGRAQVAVLPWAAAVVVLLALADAGELALARVCTDVYNRFMRKLPLNGGNAMKAEEFLLPAPQLGWLDAGRLLGALASLSVWPFYGAMLAFLVAFHIQTSPPRPSGVAAKSGGCCSTSSGSGGGCGKSGGCGGGGCGASAGKACGCGSGAATRTATPASARAGLLGGTSGQNLNKASQPANGTVPSPSRAPQLPNPTSQPAGTALQPGTIRPIPMPKPAPERPAVGDPSRPSVPVPPNAVSPPEKQSPAN